MSKIQSNQENSSKKCTGVFDAWLLSVAIALVLLFTPASVIALNIDAVHIYTVEYRSGGVLTDNYEFVAGVRGDDITQVTMNPPGGDPVDLYPWHTGQFDFGFGQEDYATLSDLRTDFPTGEYTFMFNGGEDSLTVNHDPREPTGFADITHPPNGATGVPLNPTYTWESCTKYGDALNMVLSEEDGGSFLATEIFADIDTTAWAPVTLEYGREYSLEVSVFDGVSAQPYARQTSELDDFDYFDLFEKCNEVVFTTSLIIDVEIDIKPGSYPNAINLGSEGLIPVAILSSADFDALSVDPSTVSLSGAGVAVKGKGSNTMAHEEDIDGDGLLDLVLKIETENLDPDQFQDGWAILAGETFDGQNIEGQDEITIVPDE